MNKKYLVPKKDLIIYFIISIFYMIVDLIITGNPFTSSVDMQLLYFTYISLMYLPGILGLILNSIILSNIIKKELIIKVLKILFNIFTVIWYALFWVFIYFCYVMSKAFDYVEYDELESFIIQYIV